jgi:hypothetical protein
MLVVSTEGSNPTWTWMLVVSVVREEAMARVGLQRHRKERTLIKLK